VNETIKKLIVFTLSLFILGLFFSISATKVFAKYEQAILFLSPDCSDCEELKNKVKENKIEDSTEFSIYDLGEQEGSNKYKEIAYDTCQLKEETTPLLYINDECITQKTRIEKIIDTLPAEISNYKKGKRNTEILIGIIAVILLLLIPLGKVISNSKKKVISKENK